mmetsp:Transcript_3509/g.7165  ORF Transcript_3509/g.7165 Transcript_3509/m.7165 type:complete len:391 (-) Transcript_3509:353-1525(-)
MDWFMRSRPCNCLAQASICGEASSHGPSAARKPDEDPSGPRVTSRSALSRLDEGAWPEAATGLLCLEARKPMLAAPALARRPLPASRLVSVEAVEGPLKPGGLGGRMIKDSLLSASRRSLAGGIDRRAPRLSCMPCKSFAFTAKDWSVAGFLGALSSALLSPRLCILALRATVPLVSDDTRCALQRCKSSAAARRVSRAPAPRARIRSVRAALTTMASALSTMTVKSSGDPSNCEELLTMSPGSSLTTSFTTPPPPRGPRAPEVRPCFEATAGDASSSASRIFTARAWPSRMICKRSVSDCGSRVSPSQQSTMPRRWELLRKHSSKRSCFSFSRSRKPFSELMSTFSRFARRCIRSSSTSSFKLSRLSTRNSHGSKVVAVQSCKCSLKQA